MKTVKGYETLKANTLAKTRWAKFHDDDVVLPDGDVGKYTWVETTRAGVIVIPRAPDGRVMLISIARYPARKVMWEFPRGGILARESPDYAARRELKEETGLFVDTRYMKNIGHLYPDSAFLSTRHTVFVAQMPLAWGGRPLVSLAAGEGILRYGWVFPGAVKKLVKDGVDGTALAALTLLRFHLGK